MAFRYPSLGITACHVTSHCRYNCAIKLKSWATTAEGEPVPLIQLSGKKLPPLPSTFQLVHSAAGPQKDSGKPSFGNTQGLFHGDCRTSHKNFAYLNPMSCSKELDVPAFTWCATGSHVVAELPCQTLFRIVRQASRKSSPSLNCVKDGTLLTDKTTFPA